mmetsp:Transcript_53982/g.117435  ORF Transcript_53982/g.117435 Transcript_53982/m.117435 type:complete len:183 (+) Transcript_53982:148-696(+)
MMTSRPSRPSEVLRHLCQRDSVVILTAAFMTKTVEMEKEKVKFEIWDTAGQERFRSFAPMYYRNAAAAVVVYDIGVMDSFVRAQGWVEEMRAQQTRETVIALAGNKCDLPDGARQVPADQGSQYAKEKNLIFIETSAFSGQNVAELFAEIARRVPKDKALNERGEVYNVEHPASKTKGGCCG